MPSYFYTFDLSQNGDSNFTGNAVGVNKTVTPYDVATELNTYATENKVGRVSDKGAPARDKDGFYKFKLAPNYLQPTAPTVAPGSLITLANFRGATASGHTAEQDVFFAGISRNASVNTISPERNWSHDAMTYADITQWSMASQVYNGATQVNKSTYGPGAVPWVIAGSIRIGGEATRPVQQHLLNVQPTATFTRFRADTTGTGMCAWEAWSLKPTGYTSGVTEDYAWNAGEFLGVSEYRDLAALGGNLYWDFASPITLGEGAQTVVFVPVGSFSLIVPVCAYRVGADHEPVRLIHNTGGNGFGVMPYLSNRDLPHISGGEDDTLNGNQVGTVLAATIPILPPLTTYISPDLSTIIQECIDEAGYEDNNNIAITMAHKHADTLLAAGWYLNPFKQRLEVTWTPPPVIDSFTATPDSIYVGEGSVLRWETSESDLTSIDNGIGVVTADGQQIVKPTETTTYTLTAWSAAGQVTAEITVTVDPKAAPTFTPNETSIANAALILLGEHRIDSLNEGGKTANLIAERFVELRDQLLRYVPWGFATKRASLAADAERPAWGFGFSYTLPNDCLRLIDVDSEIRQQYRIEGRSIVTDIRPPLKITYTAEVEDVTKMDVLYREALAAYIASELAEAITGSSEKMRQVYGIFRSRLEQAMAANGQEPSTRVIEHSEHIVSRGKVEE